MRFQQIPYGAGEIDGLTVNGDADAEIRVNLDPNGDGIGELTSPDLDHAVLIYGNANTYINVADKFTFDLGLQMAGVMHWVVYNETDFKVHAVVEQGIGFDLAGLQNAVPDDTTYGKLLGKLVDGFGADAEAGFTIQVCTPA